jgi:predicted nuclease of restriction endonuclease-like RecB superfamily
LSFPEKKAALVPDFTLRHAVTRERVHLEVLGFWSERGLVERVALLREARERGHRVLVAASERLGASPEALSEAVKGGVVSFKERLAPKAVLAALADSES